MLSMLTTPGYGPEVRGLFRAQATTAARQTGRYGYDVSSVTSSSRFRRRPRRSGDAVRWRFEHSADAGSTSPIATVDVARLDERQEHVGAG